jgi:hypothetical protein
MNSRREEVVMSEDSNPPVEPPSAYEPPRVETVLGDEQLEREVQYAGFNGTQLQ